MANEKKVTHTVYNAESQRDADREWTRAYQEDEDRNEAARQGHWLEDEKKD